MSNYTFITNVAFTHHSENHELEDENNVPLSRSHDIKQCEGGHCITPELILLGLENCGHFNFKDGVTLDEN